MNRQEGSRGLRVSTLRELEKAFAANRVPGRRDSELNISGHRPLPKAPEAVLRAAQRHCAARGHMVLLRGVDTSSRSSQLPLSNGTTISLAGCGSKQRTLTS